MPAKNVQVVDFLDEGVKAVEEQMRADNKEPGPSANRTKAFYEALSEYLEMREPPYPNQHDLWLENLNESKGDDRQIGNFASTLTYEQADRIKKEINQRFGKVLGKKFDIDNPTRLTATLKKIPDMKSEIVQGVSLKKFAAAHNLLSSEQRLPREISDFLDEDFPESLAIKTGVREFKRPRDIEPVLMRLKMAKAYFNPHLEPQLRNKLESRIKAFEEPARQAKILINEKREKARYGFPENIQPISREKQVYRNASELQTSLEQHERARQQNKRLESPLASATTSTKRAPPPLPNKRAPVTPIRLQEELRVRRTANVNSDHAKIARRAGRLLQRVNEEILDAKSERASIDASYDMAGLQGALGSQQKKIAEIKDSIGGVQKLINQTSVQPQGFDATLNSLLELSGRQNALLRHREALAEAIQKRITELNAQTRNAETTTKIYREPITPSPSPPSSLLRTTVQETERISRATKRALRTVEEDLKNVEQTIVWTQGAIAPSQLEAHLGKQQEGADETRSAINETAQSIQELLTTPDSNQAELNGLLQLNEHQNKLLQKQETAIAAIQTRLSALNAQTRTAETTIAINRKPISPPPSPPPRSTTQQIGEMSGKTKRQLNKVTGEIEELESQLTVIRKMHNPPQLKEYLDGAQERAEEIRSEIQKTAESIQVLLDTPDSNQAELSGLLKLNDRRNELLEKYDSMVKTIQERTAELNARARNASTSPITRPLIIPPPLQQQSPPSPLQTPSPTSPQQTGGISRKMESKLRAVNNEIENVENLIALIGKIQTPAALEERLKKQQESVEETRDVINDIQASITKLSRTPSRSEADLKGFRMLSERQNALLQKLETLGDVILVRFTQIDLHVRNARAMQEDIVPPSNINRDLETLFSTQRSSPTPPPQTSPTPNMFPEVKRQPPPPVPPHPRPKLWAEEAVDYKPPERLKEGAPIRLEEHYFQTPPGAPKEIASAIATGNQFIEKALRNFNGNNFSDVKKEFEKIVVMTADQIDHAIVTNRLLNEPHPNRAQRTSTMQEVDIQKAKEGLPLQNGKVMHVSPVTKAAFVWVNAKHNPNGLAPPQRVAKTAKVSSKMLKEMNVKLTKGQVIEEALYAGIPRGLKPESQVTFKEKPTQERSSTKAVGKKR